MFGDLYSAGVDADFLADVSAAMTPGKCAVLAELEEEWITPLDTRMESLGGVVYRTLKSTVREEQWKRDNAAAKAELDQLKAEHAQARADRKAKLQAQIDKLSKRVDLKLQTAQARAKQISLQYQAKVQALQERARALGASGAVAAVMGAFLVTYPRDQIRSLLIILLFVSVKYIRAALLIGVWFLIQFVSLGAVSEQAAGAVAHAAHVGGFVFGVVTVRLFEPRPRYAQ